jgi:Uma2 family endonuclease
MVAQYKWPYVTPEEYLRCEKDAQTKHEYIDGVIVAMAGASRQHIRITKNLTVQLEPYLDRAGCEGFPSEMRVRVEISNTYYYPDFVVACDEPDFDPTADTDTLLNPKLIIEVLSKSTERVDRVEKWMAYRQLDSLSMYLLVHQDRPLIECYVRNRPNDQWDQIRVEGLEAILAIPSLNCEIPLESIYKRVAFGHQHSGDLED